MTPEKILFVWLSHVLYCLWDWMSSIGTRLTQYVANLHHHNNPQNGNILNGLVYCLKVSPYWFILWMDIFLLWAFTDFYLSGTSLANPTINFHGSFDWVFFVVFYCSYFDWFFYLSIRDGLTQIIDPEGWVIFSVA